ncbi:MAG: bifunctional hydroxymethylpyrimidine kinase/phosphomethylpyrimidine kinase, partial [Alphaproteobacteria bacterium]|nr:bifunctional hydroxymethylpyrimidine kinase/phosphomethylpyrimidine kinase [Alphaproteobacteria bacterium]
VTTINRTAMPERAAGLLQLGSRAVLLKGGHLLEGDSDDYFLSHTNGGDAAGINAGVDGSHYQPSGKQVIGNGGSVGEWLGGRRIATNNTHGTGCTLSAAIAARAAMGDDLLSACRHAKNYLSGALMAAASSDSQLGHGAGPPHHFYRFW